MNKVCSVCGEPVGGHDPRKQYCSNACKQEAHRRRHGLDRPAFLATVSDKSVIPPETVQVTIPKSPAITSRVETDDRFIAVSQAVVELSSKAYYLQIQKESLLSKIAALEVLRSPLDDVSNGLKQSIELSQSWRESFGSDTAAKIGVALGLLGSLHRASNSEHDKINKKNRIKARVLKSELKELDIHLNELIAKKIYLENGLTQLKREIKTELTALSALSAKDKYELPNYIEPSQEVIRVTQQKENRIISLSQLKAQEFDIYEFSQGFENIIGNPSKNFSMIVYGESGQGKSTWVMDFANFLAVHHGRVLYNSSEEKISQSLKRKLMNYDSDNFAISECQTYKALKQAIRGNSFKFVVIDSINDMAIKPNQLVELTELNADKAFIYIMQATKQGQYKGSTQFVHDVDVLIKLDNYQPIVEKTRFR